MPLQLRKIHALMREINDTGLPGRDPKFCSQYDDRRVILLNAVCAEKEILPIETEEMDLDTEFVSSEVQEAFDELRMWSTEAIAKARTSEFQLNVS